MINNLSVLHPYQVKGVEFIIKTKKCALFLGMGLGKTIITLSALEILRHREEVTQTLVVAPLGVANSVWQSEVAKWAHLDHLRCSIITGNLKSRLKALSTSADIYIINRENIAWLFSQGWNKWDMIILDESSSFKNPKSLRFKCFKKAQYNYMVQLTGTPSPNGLLDLWAPMYLLDQGQRLGKTFWEYRDKYFTSDYQGYKFTPLSPESIYKQIEDVTLSMQTEDYLNLPSCIKVVTPVYIDGMPEYRKLEQEFTALIKDTQIATFSAAALSNKLLQFCNGAIYDENKNIIEIHDNKLVALKHILSDNGGENIIVTYNFQSDLKRLMTHFPEGVKLQSAAHIDDWNKGKIKLLFAHPASCGRGLNLQHGGNIIIWFGLTWNLEDYLQFNARLYRQGQLKPVIINHIIAHNCMDEIVMEALQRKGLQQQSVLDFLKSKFE